MKKKIFIPIIICFVLVIGVVGFILFDNRTISTVILDINPSIKIKLMKNDKVKSVIALNEDARDVIDSNMKNLSLNDIVKTIIQNTIEKGYIRPEEYVAIIMHTDGEFDDEELKQQIYDFFEEQKIGVEVISIDTISKEDKKLAKKYNISPSKAAYINSIKKDNNKVPIETMVVKSVSELRETKESGLYCDIGYTLRGESCERELETVSAKEGLVCPDGYHEYNGICYQSIDLIETDHLICNDEFQLIDGMCVKTEIFDSEVEYQCDIGELHKKGDLFLIGGIENSEKYYCVDKSTGQPPKLRCMISKNHLELDGRCYNGPAPLIGGGCPDGGLQRNGGCYTLDDEDQWECPTGLIYMRSVETVPDLCPDTFTYLEPQIAGYHCEDGYELSDQKCVKKETVKPFNERVCPDGSKAIENSFCINSSVTTEKIDGYYCDERDSYLRDNMCVIVEIIGAM